MALSKALAVAAILANYTHASKASLDIQKGLTDEIDEAEAALTMRNAIINLLDLRPVHIDNDLSKTESTG